MVQSYNHLSLKIILTIIKNTHSTNRESLTWFSKLLTHIWHFKGSSTVWTYFILICIGDTTLWVPSYMLILNLYSISWIRYDRNCLIKTYTWLMSGWLVCRDLRELGKYIYNFLWKKFFKIFLSVGMKVHTYYVEY